MQGSAWIALLRRIPPELHSVLALGLVTGAEVVVQQIIRLEENFVIVRGRMSGSTAEGRIMAVPYAHMTLVAITKRMSEPEVQKLFGRGMPTAPLVVDAEGTPAAGDTESAAQDAVESETGAVEPADAASPAPVVLPEPAKSKTAPPSKSVLLARLRERLAEKAK